jgi:hypothetical protein
MNVYAKLVPGARGAPLLAAAALAVGPAGYAEAQQPSVFTPKLVNPGVYIGAEGDDITTMLTVAYTFP